jgi:WXG100 family type VII secretion target
MTMLVVDFAQLQAAIDHMTRFHTQLTDVLADVDHTMAGLRATWHGDASDSQAEAQQRWKEGADQMQKALEQLKTIADGARKNYTDAVTGNMKMWSG